MVPFERALVSFYRPPIVTFPLSLRISEILPLLFRSMPLFPTPPRLPKFSPCSPGIRWIAFLATKSEGVGLIVRAISSKISNLCDHNPPTLQTDRQTDRRHAIPRPRICTKVHCAVKTVTKRSPKNNEQQQPRSDSTS